MTTTTKELIEKLSDYMHNVWSNWYLYQRKFTNEENEIRWSNQSITKYKNLSEEDKEKDRKFAREILKIIEKHLQELPQQEVETYEQGLEDGRKEVLDKVEELISKIKILEITGLPLYYNIIIKQLEDVFTSYNQRGQ